MIKLKWGVYDGPLSNMTGILIKRGNLDTRQACTQGENHIKTQGENNYLQVKERGLRRI